MSILWDKIPNFERKEFDDPYYPGSGDFIDPQALDLIVRLRLDAGCPIIVHGMVGGAVDVDGSWDHADESLHRKDQGCRAIDFHFRTNIPPRNQCWLVVKSGFTGIGFYYDQHWNDKPLSIGFHVDKRPRERFQLWKRVNREYIYLLQ